jgi:hypothetical protein
MDQESNGAPPPDELLEKLDRLLHRHRLADEPVPTLPTSLPDADVPTLTDIVAGPYAQPDVDKSAESRLIAAVGREVARLQAEMPQRAAQLAVLGSTLNAAIRLLARRYLDDHAPDDEK